MINYLSPIIPIYGLIAVGALIKTLGVADDTWVNVLNRYGFYIGFPVLIFVQLYNLEGIPVSRILPLAALNIVFLSVVFFGCISVGMTLGFSTRAVSTFAVAGTFGNIAFLGFPVITAMYSGVEAETSLVVTAYVFTLFSFGILYLELTRTHSVHIARIFLRVVTHPFIIAIMLGVTLNATDTALPGVVSRITDMVSASVTPVVLIALGVFAAQGYLLRANWPLFIVIVVFKMIVLPLLAFLTVNVTGITIAAEVTVLQAATPVAVTAFTLVTIYELDSRPVAAALVVTTALSVVTYPAFAALLASV